MNPMIAELEWLALRAREAGDMPSFHRYLARADSLRSIAA